MVVVGPRGVKQVRKTSAKSITLRQTEKNSKELTK